MAQALAFLIDVVFGLLTYAFLLRFAMQALRAPFRNPLGQAVIALTDWAIKPLRRILPGFRGLDWASLLATYVSQLLWLLAYYAVFGQGFALSGIGVVYLLVAALIALLKAALWLLIIVVFAQAILSWVAPDGPLSGLLNALSFPFLRPIRRVIPPIGGVLDLSPLIVIVLAQLVLMLLIPWMQGLATTLLVT
jgi:YggT family protein